jgi:ferredoxin-NADP reductase
VLGREVHDLVQRKRGWLYEFVGPREQASVTGQALREIVPDLHRRDVYVCGPEGFVTSMVDLLRGLRVPDEAIHHEAFAL